MLSRIRGRSAAVRASSSTIARASARSASKSVSPWRSVTSPSSSAGDSGGGPGLLPLQPPDRVADEPSQLLRPGQRELEPDAELVELRPRRKRRPDEHERPGEPANSCAVSRSVRSVVGFSRCACGSFRIQTPSGRGSDLDQAQGRREIDGLRLIHGMARREPARGAPRRDGQGQAPRRLLARATRSASPRRSRRGRAGCATGRGPRGLGRADPSGSRVWASGIGAFPRRRLRLRHVAAPRRIVSLCPSITETLVALGAWKRLVGATRYCVRPEGLLWGLPRIGGTKNPDIARILDLKPDLVFANEEENRREDVEALEAAGIEVDVTFPKSVAEVPDAIRAWGRRLARTRPRGGARRPHRRRDRGARGGAEASAVSLRLLDLEGPVDDGLRTTRTSRTCFASRAASTSTGAKRSAIRRRRRRTRSPGAPTSTSFRASRTPFGPKSTPPEVEEASSDRSSVRLFVAGRRL